jgi:hypothetical protein
VGLPRLRRSANEAFVIPLTKKKRGQSVRALPR